MTERIKKQGKAAYLVLAAAVFAIAGFVVYLVNATTGYMAGRELSALIICATLAAVVGLASVVLAGGRLDSKLVDLLLVASGVLLIVGFSLFILDRVSIIADIYFLPVNYPASEAATMNGAFAGFACYLLAIICVTAAAFMARPDEGL